MRFITSDLQGARES